MSTAPRTFAVIRNPDYKHRDHYAWLVVDADGYTESEQNTKAEAVAYAKQLNIDIPGGVVPLSIA